MRKEIFIPIAIALISIILLVWLAPSNWVKGIFILFVLLSLLFYFFLYEHKPELSRELAVWYFIALAIQCLHFIEEYMGTFYVQLPELMDTTPLEKDDFVLFNLSAYAIFIVGGIAIIKNYKALMLIPIFYILLGVLGNGVIHVLLGIWSWSYFPGLYTAIVFLFLGPVLIRMLLGKSSSAGS